MRHAPALGIIPGHAACGMTGKVSTPNLPARPPRSPQPSLQRRGRNSGRNILSGVKVLRNGQDVIAEVIEIPAWPAGIACTAFAGNASAQAGYLLAALELICG